MENVSDLDFYRAFGLCLVLILEGIHKSQQNLQN